MILRMDTPLGCNYPILWWLLNLMYVLYRESGAVGSLARIILLAAESPDLGQIAQLRLLPALGAACGAVVALAQDCEENQRTFLSQPELLPALFRLMNVNEPGLASQAARYTGLHAWISLHSQLCLLLCGLSYRTAD